MMTERTGQLAPLAIHQLRAWEEIADTWVMYVQSRMNGPKTEYHAVCGACEETVSVLENDTGYYLMTLQQIRASIVAHLRNRHRDLDPDHE